MKKLQPIFNKLSMIPNLNRGGCGIVALALYYWIKKNLDSKVKFVFLSDFYDEHQSNKSAVESNDYTRGIVPAHVGVIYLNQKIDGKGIMSRREKRSLVVEDVDFLRYLIKNGCWNSQFDRKKYVPKIAKIMELDQELLIGE